MNDRFSIIVLPESSRGPDGERLGEIRTGDFTERFGLSLLADDVTRLQMEWKKQLQALLAGTAAVALQTDPRMAWIFYRGSESVFIQQHLLVDGWTGCIDGAGKIVGIPDRTTVSEEGLPISEWRTTIAAIREFVTNR